MSTENALLTILVEKINNDTLVLPTLPAIALQVRRTADDPDVNLGKMGDVISKDPSLAARIIKIANSAYLGRTVKVNSVSQAVTRIGLQQIKNIATALAMEQLFVSKNTLVGEYLRKEWADTIEVVANSLAALQTYANKSNKREISVDTMTLTALVHNIGVLPILTEAERNEDVFANPTFLDEAIQKVSGPIGGSIMREWGFGPSFVNSAEHWRDISMVPKTLGYLDFVRVGAALAGRMGDKKEVVLKRAIERGALSGIEDVETEEFAELRNNARQIFA